jgi:hypothetical protein
MGGHGNSWTAMYICECRQSQLVCTLYVRIYVCTLWRWKLLDLEPLPLCRIVGTVTPWIMDDILIY